MNTEELCASIRNTLPDLFECSPAPKGGTRIRTPLLYPDGGVVDVFVTEQEGRYCVTDFGETLGWLDTQSANVRRSPRQERMIEDTCHTLGIELHRGQLVLPVSPDDSLGEVIVRLAQAAIRVSDLWFTLRTRVVQTTADEVEEWLREKQIVFDRSVKKQGCSGSNWTIDFQTSTPNRTSLVFLLSTGSRGSVRRITEHVVAGCTDLGHLKQDKLSFVSLFDDISDVWQEMDYRMVEQCSQTVNWSRPDEFEHILRAE